MAEYETIMRAMRNAHAAGDTAAAKRLANMAIAARQGGGTDPAVPAPPQPSGPGVLDYVEQAGAGSQSGIAQALGFPVDAVSGAISGVGQLTGLYDPIENPVGGSQFFDELISPLRAGVPEPDTAGLRMARRVGEEVGASATMAPIAMSSSAVRAAPAAFAGIEGASALGSGVGAGLAQEMFPDSATAEIVGALAGGIPSGMAAGRALGTGASDAVVRGGIDEQRRIASQAYDTVRADQMVIPPEETRMLVDSLDARMQAERINPRLQPNSAAILDALISEGGRPMRVEDIEDLRRLTTESMPATASRSDQRLSQIMKSEITDYLEGVDSPAAEALSEGRDAHRRALAAETIDSATTRAQRHAASTGSGGNEINAMRQKIRQILDNPRRSRSFNSDELAAMDAFVRGDVGSNWARRLSRVAPSSGGLSSMLGLGGLYSMPEVAGPLTLAAEIGKFAGERMGRRSADQISQMIAPDRILQTSQEGVRPIIQALLGLRAYSGAGE